MAWATGPRSRYPFIGHAVEPDRASSGTEWNPVEVHTGGTGIFHGHIPTVRRQRPILQGPWSQSGEAGSASLLGRSTLLGRSSGGGWLTHTAASPPLPGSDRPPL